MCRLSYFLLFAVVFFSVGSQQANTYAARGLGDAIVNTHILTVFTYQGNQIYVYGAISNENENLQTPQKWIFYYVPVMLPVLTANQWITSSENEIRATLTLGNDEVENLARRSIIKKYDYQTISQYSKYWDVAPLMIDSLTAFIIKSSTNTPVEGAHPFTAFHPNTLTMMFRFECSTQRRANDIIQLIRNGDYSIEIAFYFAGFKQITTNFVSITGSQMKSVFSKTIADGGMDTVRETQLDAKLYDQVWSSSDLSPDRITSEIQSFFTYNETETRRHNYTDIYFDVDSKKSQSNTTSANIGLSFGYQLLNLGLFSSGSLSSNSSHSEHTTTHVITTATDIQHFTDQQSVQTAWTGEKWVPKSFKLFKLIDMNDVLQVALLAKQVMAEKQNGAIIRTVNTIHSPILTHTVKQPPMLTGEGRLFFGVAPPPLPWLLCDGRAISRIEYQRLFSVIGTKYGQGDSVTTFNLPDFRGRVAVGVDGSNFSNVGLTGGRAMHRLTIEELPSHTHQAGSLSLSYAGSHTHSYTDPGHNHGGQTGRGPQGLGPHYHHNAGRGGQSQDSEHTHSIATDRTNIVIHHNGDHTHTIQGETSRVGLGQQFSLMQPYQTVNYIIYAD
ncbi:unnamed protein product [Rotaria sp. Silwood2]|nr:unnamed protein product [Rotaria sp. Silwood2]CAF2713267.1 unnamed protein product [Rotaria sp. Silwood2]CAF3299275.1 unnamed protein product [Rotaria sp. Silwood2]CAF3305120.1 unnamed protein product [Rotaria sp. Silwood2]CAF4016017.1 unnamed protein product [Rotaria sp. Silwood2]